MPSQALCNWSSDKLGPVLFVDRLTTAGVTKGEMAPKDAGKSMLVRLSCTH